MEIGGWQGPLQLCRALCHTMLGCQMAVFGDVTRTNSERITFTLQKVDVSTGDSPPAVVDTSSPNDSDPPVPGDQQLTQEPRRYPERIRQRPSYYHESVQT